LQDEIRTEQQEENKQKGDIHQRHKDNPPEIEVYRAVKLHEASPPSNVILSEAKNL